MMPSKISKEAIDCKFLSAIQFPGILIVNLQWLAPTTLIDGGRGHVDDDGGKLDHEYDPEVTWENFSLKCMGTESFSKMDPPIHQPT